jgi:hypothetical protein
MAKDERERIAVGKQSSKGAHGGNRAGGKDQEREPQRSNPHAGKDPGRGGRPAQPSS